MGIADASTSRYDTCSAAYISTHNATKGTTDVASANTLRQTSGRA